MTEEERRQLSADYPPLIQQSSTNPLRLIEKSGNSKDLMKVSEGRNQSGHPRNSSLKICEGFKPPVLQASVVEGKGNTIKAI